VAAEDMEAKVSEEASAHASIRGRWHAEYLGYAYRSAVEMALARSDGTARTVLKTDLWNEVLGGARDIAGHFHEKDGLRFVGVDLDLGVCARARSRVRAVGVVGADIRALPFRTGSFDAVLDLSTLDHLSESGAALAVDEYRRVLRGGGVLLLIFWQRNALMTLRLLLKRLLGRREKPDQHYLASATLRSKFGAGLSIVEEFAAGSLLVPPQPLTNLLLRSVPAKVLAAFLRWLVALERSAGTRPLLVHLAGLRGIVALRGRAGPGARR
jgi:SAM-dependent methyltransferase